EIPIVMISTICPRCGVPLNVPDEFAGREVRCGGCRTVFAAPLPPADVLPVLEEADPDPAPPPRRRPPYGRRPPLQRRRGGRTLLLVGIVAGVLLLGCVGGAGVIYLLFVHEIEEPVTAADRGVVITAEDVARFVPMLKFEPGRGTFRKVRHLDG